MTKFNIPSDCDNSPKKAFLKDFNIAFMTGDVDTILKSVSTDIEWEMVGDKVISGLEDFKSTIMEMADFRAEVFTIHQIITHGKDAALTGEFVDSDNTYSFCDVYELVSAGKNSIRKIRSYLIKLK